MEASEEIKKAVLAECELLTKDNQRGIIIEGKNPLWVCRETVCVKEDGTLRLLMPSFPNNDRWERGYLINCYGMHITIWSGSTEQDWRFAYRLLGLESRALEARIKQLENALLDIASIDGQVRTSEHLGAIPKDAWIKQLGYVVGRAQAALEKSANGGEPQPMIEGRTGYGC